MGDAAAASPTGCTTASRPALQNLSTTEDGAYTSTAQLRYEALNIGHPQERTAKWAIASEDEWYKAAYHKNDGVTGNYWEYPTGSDTVPTPIPPVTGGTAPDTAIFSGNGGPGPNSNADVNNAGGLSAYGTMGQGGNVSEWTELMWFDGWWRRGVLGGGLYSSSDGLAASSYGAFGNSTLYEHQTTGFRVVSSEAVPEPATLIIWSLLGGLGIAIGRWRRRKAA